MNKIFKSALAALPLLMLASCAEDDLVVDDGIAKATETRYLSVTLSSANSTPVSRWNEGDTDGTEDTGDQTADNPGKPVVGDDGYYADGPENENVIKTLTFYFYDRNKNYHSDKNLNIDFTGGDWPTNADGAFIPNQTGDVANRPNLSGFFHCNVPVDIVQGETYPEYVICIVNAVSPSAYQNMSLAQAQQKLLDTVYGGDSKEGSDKKFFGMNNSVYYGMDEVTGKDNVLIMATPLKTEMLKTETEMDKLSKEELEAVTVNIYVERYAAKVNLDLSSLATKENIPDYAAGNTDDKGVSTVSLEFTPVAWGVNTIEKEFYFIKSYRQFTTTSVQAQTQMAEGFESYEAMCGYLFDGWNNPDYHRSFWARTPGYYSGQFPITADDVKNPKNKYTVDYLTWDDCVKANKNGGGAITDFSAQKSAYVKETTMMKNRLNGDDMPSQYLPTASIPSVVLVGKYNVKGKAADKDLYAYGKNEDNVSVFYANANDAADLGLTDIMTRMLDDQTILAKKTGVDSEDHVTSNATWSAADFDAATRAEYFEIAHPSDAVRRVSIPTDGTIAGEAGETEIKVAADVHVLQLKKAKDDLYFFNAQTRLFEQVTADKLDLVNRLLLQNLGGAHYYKQGMAFFSAPIYHWGWYRADNPNVGNKKKYTVGTDGTITWEDIVPAEPIASMNDWNWKVMKTGDFGVVRNHVYTMKIGKIKGLGTAIPDPTVPIVPPADKVGYEVHFHVNIQRWAVLPVQEWNW